MKNLDPITEQSVIARLPSALKDVLFEFNVFVCGGFIRAVVADEQPSDIDVFGAAGDIEAAAYRYASLIGVSVRKTENSFSVTNKAGGYLPVQFVHRWTDDVAEDAISRMDFTVCQAAIFYAGELPDRNWHSTCCDSFLDDVLNRRLVYTKPSRPELAAGSLGRVKKYLARGYQIDDESFGAVIARALDGQTFSDEPEAASFFTRSLRTASTTRGY